jgi:predicted nucleic acid-binding protein
MTISDPILLDTNILVYAADASSPFHNPSRDLRDRGIEGEVSICVTPQVLSEFFAVVTNPRRVQSSRSPDGAMAEVEKYYRAENFLKIYPKEDTVSCFTTADF